MRLLLMGFSERYSLQNSPHTVEVLKQDISATVISVGEETVAAIVRTCLRRLHMALDADSAYIENIFT
jgi:hypothetical protein